MAQVANLRQQRRYGTSSKLAPAKEVEKWLN